MATAGIITGVLGVLLGLAFIALFIILVATHAFDTSVTHHPTFDGTTWSSLGGSVTSVDVPNVNVPNINVPNIDVPTVSIY